MNLCFPDGGLSASRALLEAVEKSYVECKNEVFASQKLRFCTPEASQYTCSRLYRRFFRQPLSKDI